MHPKTTKEKRTRALAVYTSEEMEKERRRRRERERGVGRNKWTSSERANDRIYSLKYSSYLSFFSFSFPLSFGLLFIFSPGSFSFTPLSLSPFLLFSSCYARSRSPFNFRSFFYLFSTLFRMHLYFNTILLSCARIYTCFTSILHTPRLSLGFSLSSASFSSCDGYLRYHLLLCWLGSRVCVCACVSSTMKSPSKRRKRKRNQTKSEKIESYLKL